MARIGPYVPPIAAGLTFAAYGVFGALPVPLGLARTLGLDEPTTAAWFFSVSIVSGLGTLPLLLRYREPYSIGFNVAAAILLASAGARYGWPALLGASAVAGAVIAIAGLAGVGRLALRLLPLPLVMAMFAGSILRLATDAFAQLGTEPLIGGAAVAGYFATRLLSRDRLPPTIGALALALAATALTGRWPAAVPVALTLPRYAGLDLDAGAIATLVVPVVLIVVGTSNVQAIGFMRAQGYRAPVDLLTFCVGLFTVVTALLGGTPSGMARVGAAIVSGPDAGRKELRWIASFVAAVIFVIVAFLAIPISALAFSLPRSLVTTVAALAIVNALLDALRIAFTSKLPYSSFFAFLIAFSPFAPLGLEAAFWALVAGMVLAVVFEREALRTTLAEARATPR
ncbi:MAG TPA: benzoate/H(+) symporter BenE family transporter [Candidatus Limnocylindria bacterium]